MYCSTELDVLSRCDDSIISGHQALWQDMNNVGVNNSQDVLGNKQKNKSQCFLFSARYIERIRTLLLKMLVISSNLGSSMVVNPDCSDHPI